MKVIYPEKIISVAADSEDANFPAVNVLDNHPKKVWKALSNTAKLTISMSGGANSIALFNVNADTLTLTVKDSNGNVVETQDYDLRVIDSYTAFITDQPVIYKQIWMEYTYQSSNHTLEIYFQAVAGDVVSVGIVKAGLIKQFSNPRYGLKEGFRDYSIVKELNNGAIYVRKRNIVRTFSGSFYASWNRDFYTFRDLYLEVGVRPLAWLLVDGFNNKDWVVYARFDVPPSGGHKHLNRSEIDFTLVEVV